MSDCNHRMRSPRAAGGGCGAGAELQCMTHQQGPASTHFGNYQTTEPSSNAPIRYTDSTCEPRLMTVISTRFECVRPRGGSDD